MAKYILRRLVLTIPTLFLVMVATFAIIRMQPGDVILQRIAEGGTLTPEQKAQLAAELGLDLPAPVQFAHWLGDVARGDLGNSFLNTQPVTEILFPRLLVSAEVGFYAIVVAVALAIPLGVASAYYRGSALDFGARSFAVLGLSLPDFFIGLFVIVMLVHWWGWLPPLTYASFATNPIDHLVQISFPVLIVGYRRSAVIMRLMRSATLEVLGQDYVRTARAKGLTEARTIFVHVARNALVPIVTIIGLQFAHMFNALVVIELLFGLPGLGFATYEAATSRDYPVVQGAMLLLAIITVLSNLVVDISYGFIDPRMKTS